MPKLYTLKIHFKNGNKIDINDIIEYVFARNNLFVKKINGDCLTFPKKDISEAYRKLDTMKDFKKILIPSK